MQVLNAHVADRVRVIAVQVEERLEAVFFAAVEEPVDRALLINFAVVFKEVVQEIIPQRGARRCAFRAQGARDEVQVCFQRFRAEGGADESREARHDVVAEIFFVRYGDAVVGVRHERGVF